MGSALHEFEEVLTDIAAVVFASPIDSLTAVVALQERLGKGVGKSGGADDTATVGEQVPFAVALGATVEDQRFVVGTQVDDVALFVGVGVSVGFGVAVGVIVGVGVCVGIIVAVGVGVESGIFSVKLRDPSEGTVYVDPPDS